MKKIILSVVLVLALSVIVNNSHAQNFNGAVLKATLLTQFPDPARAGDTVEVRVVLKNIGTEDAKSVVASIILKYPFTPLSGETYERSIDIIPQSPQEASSKTLIFKMGVDKNAIDGNHDLVFSQTIGNSPFGGSNVFDIDVTSKEFAQIVYIDKTKLVPGFETPITFTVNNIGKAPLTNMIFSWKEKDNIILPVGADNTRYIPLLDVNKSIGLKYNVIANPTATRGLYTLDLSLTFDIRNQTGSAANQKIDTRAGILVGGETDFDVSFAESASGTTSISIANIGQNDASSVTVTIPDQSDFVVSGGSSSIIGNLNKGDFTLATFQISPRNFNGRQENNTKQGIPQRPEPKNLKIDISYTDSFGERHKIEKSMIMQTDLSGRISGSPLPFVGGVNGARRTGNIDTIFLSFVIIVIVVVLVFVYRKKRKKRQ